ncbi:hypothetical protein [Fibrobacter sp.]|jgi:hypothetical protein
MSKKITERQLGALGVLLVALDQEGGENAVHIDFLSFIFAFYRRFYVIFATTGQN